MTWKQLARSVGARPKVLGKHPAERSEQKESRACHLKMGHSEPVAQLALGRRRTKKWVN